MKDFIGLGEILIDAAPYEVNQEVCLYQMNPGGAPANVSCVLAKLGHDTAFIGKVGKDCFGSRCEKAIKEAGVDTGYLVWSELPTTIALVSLTETGDRSFSFYRTGTADVSLSVEDIDAMEVEVPKIFHFGSVSMTAEPAASATLYMAQKMKEAGSIISYDPNLRPPLWKDLETAKEQILEAVPLANILKISQEEAEILWGTADPRKACELIRAQYGTEMVLVTCAKDGCVCLAGDTILEAQAYDVVTIDTTGAGDSFLGGVLHQLLMLQKKPSELTAQELAMILDYGNAVGSLATIKKGAIPAIPTLQEIADCIAHTSKLEKS